MPSETLRPRGLVPRCLATAACAVAILAVGTVSAVAQKTLDRVREGGVLRIGVAGEPPYGYLDENGRATGEAPEIARRIVQDIDPSIEISGVEVPFGDLIASLNAGKFDVIAAGMYVTPSRCAEVRFSTPTYKVGEAFAVKTGNPKKLRDFDDIARTHDAKVAIMAGAVEYNYAYEAGIPGDRALLYPDYNAALRAMGRGEVDAIAMTALTVRALIQQRGLTDVEATPQFFPEIEGRKKAGYGAFGFRKSDEALYEAFNSRLKDFVGTEAHWALVRPFGFTKRMKPDMTVDTLCEG